MSDLNSSTAGLSVASKSQSSQAMLVQTYCNSILQQPAVDFSGFSTLANGAKMVTIGKQINAALTAAQGHANNYLNSIQPTIITNLANISAWCALNQAIPTALPSGSTEQQWLDALTALSGQSASYQTSAKDTAASLMALNTALSGDSAAFTSLVSELNALVSGDNGALSDLNKQLDTIQSQIDGCIAGIVLSGLAIIGGVFIAAVGGIADFVTAGASTPVLVGGIAIVCAGVAGEVASSIELANFTKAKAAVYSQKASLESEVSLAGGISSAYTSFNTQVKTAAQAATQMANAWTFLAADLSTLTTDLKNGTTSAGVVRTLFLTAANTTMATVTTDVVTIKQQMTGVTNLVAPKSTDFAEYIKSMPKLAA